MDIVQGLRSFDPQGLSSDQLRQAVDLLAIAAIRAKAAAQLQPAFVAESAEFQGFGRLALQRLESTLQYVFVTPDSLATAKIEVLRGLDAISFIVCGLCLSKKTLVRLDKALFEEVVRQARGSSHRLVNIIMASDEVAEVVRKSGAEAFKQSRPITATYLERDSDGIRSRSIIGAPDRRTIARSVTVDGWSSFLVLFGSEPTNKQIQPASSQRHRRRSVDLHTYPSRICRLFNTSGDELQRETPEDAVWHRERGV
ncbi:hypothetical protein HIM_11417 [Hirsutella minnesotensis 3608]|uniref:Uncharacterized protein n=1 Tax=Hirsutella minnesotensis 3608 TaxID=1043627 RepID=A0A0F8A177_9HYPO|nr:hypothetical protein HIM_11417 [Hirsutella minnesotensis 3608]